MANHFHTSAPLITLDQLTIRFGNFTAVDTLSLSVDRGELFGFLGPNGAGKTTTIRCLNGAVKATSGSLSINGFSLPEQFHHVKPTLGYVPDVDNHYLDLTARENLTLYAKLYGVKQQKVDHWLEKLQLTEAANLKVSTFSRGMKKKLLIAREFLHDPTLLFFDEPTANLDPHSIQLVRELMREQVAAGTTIFLTTHDMEEVEAICDRVAIISRGKLIECDTPTAFITRHADRHCDVQYDRDDQIHREVFDLDDPLARDQLCQRIQAERCLRLHSREFRFEDVFKKLTGETYR